MFKTTKTHDDSAAVKDVIDAVKARLLGMDPDTDEFAKTVDQLSKLMKIHAEGTDRISKDVLLTVGANLLGILLILNFEHARVVTSKAVGFIMKPKV